MNFLSGLFGKKSEGAPQSAVSSDFEVELDTQDFEHDQDFQTLKSAAEATQSSLAQDETVQDPSDVSEINLGAVESVLDSVGKARQSSVNIWDLDPEQEEVSAAIDVASAGASSRARRNRTRLIGFDKSDGDVVDLFEDSEEATSLEGAKFPVGWVVVIEGPGRGSCFSLTTGMAQIGRGEDQTIRLDFGDNAISRNNHAAIVYDPAERKFLLGHGGKANIVRLNGQPVISNENLNDGDRIHLGETTLMLKTLCCADFDWDDTSGGEEHDDVAIA